MSSKDRSVLQATGEAAKEVGKATADIVGQTAKTANTAYENVTNIGTNITTAAENLTEAATAGTKTVSNVANSVSSFTGLLKKFLQRREIVSENKNVQMQAKMDNKTKQMQNKTEGEKMRDENKFKAEEAKLIEERLKLEANIRKLNDPKIKQQYNELAEETTKALIATEQHKTTLEIAQRQREAENQITQSNLDDHQQKIKLQELKNKSEFNLKFLQIGFYNNKYTNLIIPRYWFKSTIPFKIIDKIQIKREEIEIDQDEIKEINQDEIKVRVPIRKENYIYEFTYNGVTYNFGHEQLSVLAGADNILNTPISAIPSDVENKSVKFTIKSFVPGGQYEKIVTKRFWRGGKKTKKQRRKLKRKTKRRKNHTK